MRRASKAFLRALEKMRDAERIFPDITPQKPTRRTRKTPPSNTPIEYPPCIDCGEPAGSPNGRCRDCDITWASRPQPGKDAPK